MATCSFDSSTSGKAFWFTCRLSVYSHLLEAFWKQPELSKHSIMELTNVIARVVGTTDSLLRSEKPETDHKWMIDLGKEDGRIPRPNDDLDTILFGELKVATAEDGIETPRKFFTSVRDEHGLDLYTILNDHIKRLRTLFMTSSIFNPAIPQISRHPAFGLKKTFVETNGVAAWSEVNKILRVVYPKTWESQPNRVGSCILQELSIAYELTNSLMGEQSTLADFPICTRQAIGLIFSMIDCIYGCIHSQTENGMFEIKTPNGPVLKPLMLCRAASFLRMLSSDPADPNPTIAWPKNFTEDLMTTDVKEFVCEEYATQQLRDAVASGYYYPGSSA